jgi:glutamate/tyrosine decarboxylase-like PLP-dependent enzyme
MLTPRQTNGYSFIPQSVQDSAEFKRVTAKISTAVQQTASMLGRHSIPFWSPRYQAHMCTDLSMPAMLGYMMTMMYNPNNVALEASPISTVAEIEVGEQLCEMFGFVNNPENKNDPTGWGHVTCGGTVANLESIWVGEFWQGRLQTFLTKTSADIFPESPQPQVLSSIRPQSDGRP